MKQMGETGREFVRENFLLTRNLRDYLILMIAIRSGRGERVIYV
jgi:trehalose synthase